MPSADFEIRELKPGDKLTGLSLGEEQFAPLKIFLTKKAKSFHTGGLGRTYVALNGTKLVGYITLVCGQIDSHEQTKRECNSPEYTYDHFPAVKIARLAVDRRAQGLGLGRTLTNMALGIIKDIVCPAVGCRFAVVDSKSHSVGFYEKCGFTALDTAENRARSERVMFIDLHGISVIDVPSENIAEPVRTISAANDESASNVA